MPVICNRASFGFNAFAPTDRPHETYHGCGKKYFRGCDGSHTPWAGIRMLDFTGEQGLHARKVVLFPTSMR